MRLNFASLLVFLFPLNALGQTGSYGAHIHGSAELTVASEGNTIQMNFIVPAMSAVGFESKVTSPDQVAAVENARMVLADPESVVTFVDKQCDLVSSSLDFSAILETAKHDGNEAHIHSSDHVEMHDDHKEAQEKHAHASHDEHSDHESAEREEAHDGETEGHSDIEAKYEFECTGKDELKQLNFGSRALIFELDTIKIMWVSQRGQGAVEVGAGQALVDLQ